ncbi:capsule assembly Wzi family protein [Spirosoma flavum]|uniref:Capsule assembly Wzi family protein n=1 Tax=Spirosoma flavum TaxID=2048557 RepID=A0ABW6AFY7_9BACT
MRFYTGYLVTIFLFFDNYKVIGQQDSVVRTTQISSEVGALLTSGRMIPFWQRANQYGTAPLAGSFGTVRLGVSSDYRALPSRRVDWGYGLEVVGNVGGLNQQIILPQAYIKARWRQIELYAGRRRNIIGLVDTLLTSGAYSMSGNALPLPTIQLGTRGYAPLRFTKGVISINATYGHAWFETVNRKVYHTLLHQSSFYLRVGKPSWAFRLYAGINHQAVWGGYSPYLGSNVSNDGHLPSSLKAYFYVVTMLPSSDLTVDGNISTFDETNRVGNHLGSLDLGAEFDIGDCTFLVYRQNPYDTGAIWYLTTIADGLNGLSIRRKHRGRRFISVDRGLIEFLYTANQGGNQFVIDNPQLRGKVDYFNNSQYIDGWTTRGHIIGTPFITPEGDIRPNMPYGPIANNRVSVLHAGLSGRIGESGTWLIKLSESQNLGTYNAPFPSPLNQFSGLAQVSAPLQIPLLGDTRLNMSVAVDQGSLLPNAVGFYAGLRKNLSLKSPASPEHR